MYPTSSSDSSESRRSELAARLAEVTARIEKACATAGRDVAEVTMVAVTKTYPVEDVRLLRELGVRDFGENRDQEGKVKAAMALRQSVPLDIAWHFIGQLQTRKAGSVAQYADYVHSVDRIRLVTHLGAGARAASREITCLVQVSIDGDPERGGVPAGGVAAVAEAIEAEAGLVLGGVMAVAPMGTDPAGAFAALRHSAAAVRAVRARARIISAGMSSDLEEAVAAGATHLRIGTALLGDRKPPVR